jgi:hypothetical protein
LLWKIKQWVLPNCKSPAERLRDVIREYEFSLSQELKVELLDIADKIDFHNEAPTTEAKKYTLEVA